MNTILLQDLLNVKQMQRIQDTLTEFLGVGVIAVDVNGIPITESSTFSYFCNHLIHKTPDGLEQCKACDAILSTPESKEHISFYHCHAGLTAFSIPLYINNQIIAYFVGGQVLTKPLSSEELQQSAKQLNVDLNEFTAAINKVPVIPIEQLTAIGNFIVNVSEIVCLLAYSNYKSKLLNTELERSTELKSHFLANMSHEIRTPMNAIIGMAEMALREDLPTKARNYISQIKSSGKILLTIINDILDFSKIESGKLEITNVEYEVLSLVNDLISTINTRIGDKDIELFVEVDPTIPYKLYGDDVRIKQVMVNLANNAVKFTQHGFVIIRISGSRQNNKLQLTVSVKDTGIGIKKEDMNKLFGLFQQLDSKRNRNIEGTGLGLKISQELVRLMKGTISVNSVYGKGSEFSFTIPQLIVRDTPCSSLIENPKHFKIVGFIDHPTVEQNFRHLMNELQLDYIPCSNPDEVISHSEATHLFVSASLYTGTLKDYMDHLPSGIGVIITNHNHFISLPNHLKEIKKPLYCLNVSNILNNVEMLNVERPDMDILNFVAPEARILIVDDNTVNITVTLGLLEPLNMLCDTALSGDEAIAKIKKHQYDIIFMDHMMPVKDGVETTHEIRALPIPYCSSVPIIALSANALRGAREMFIDEGMNDFVAKPIELRDIISKLRQWLPSHKIIKSSHLSSPEDTEVDKVPKIAGLDTEFGLSMAGSVAIYKKVLTSYYESIEKKANLIAQYEKVEDITNYTIEVHALKSTSKLIGALELSFLAEKLEHAGNNNNLEMIHHETDGLLKIYRGYSYLLRPYVEVAEETAPTIIANDNEIRDCVTQLLQALKDFDIDLCDQLIAQLKTYQLDSRTSQLLIDLEPVNTELNYDLGCQIIQQFLNANF